MKRIHIGTLDVDDEEKRSIISTLESGLVSASPIIEEFEDKISTLHGKKHGILVNSGQSALEVAFSVQHVQQQ